MYASDPTVIADNHIGINFKLHNDEYLQPDLMKI